MFVFRAIYLKSMQIQDDFDLLFTKKEGLSTKEYNLNSFPLGSKYGNPSMNDWAMNFSWYLIRWMIQPMYLKKQTIL